MHEIIQRIERHDDLEDFAMILLAGVMRRAPDVDFSANDRAMFTLGVAATLAALGRGR